MFNNYSILEPIARGTCDNEYGLILDITYFDRFSLKMPGLNALKG